MSIELASFVSRFFPSEFAREIVEDLTSQLTPAELKKVLKMGESEFRRYYFREVPQTKSSHVRKFGTDELPDSSSTLLDHPITSLTFDKILLRVESIGLSKQFEMYANKER